MVNMFDISTYILDCYFSFNINTIDQISSQFDSSVLIKSFEFDFSISGFMDDNEYFLINRIIFENIVSLYKGESKIEIETISNPKSVDFNGLFVVNNIANFIKNNNSSFFLIDSNSKDGIIEIAFNDLYIS